MTITRREFIKRTLLLGLVGLGTGTLVANTACGPRPSPTPTPGVTPTPTTDATAGPTGEAAYLSVARGESPTAMVQAAIDALGGTGRFVKPGDDVIVKPNIGTAGHSYEYAMTTNPEVVGAIVALCVGAGASRVRVMDIYFSGDQRTAHADSGIADAVLAAGGEMEVIMSELKFPETPIPQGRSITSWRIYDEILNTDVLINVPIAKAHGLAVLTLGMKNLFGIILSPWRLHDNLGQNIADINSVVRPDLTVVDAVRTKAGLHPYSGSLGDVKLMNTIIASHDIVAADSYAATLFGMTGADVPAIVAGADMGLGTMDLQSIKIKEIDV